MYVQTADALKTIGYVSDFLWGRKDQNWYVQTIVEKVEYSLVFQSVLFIWHSDTSEQHQLKT